MGEAVCTEQIKSVNPDWNFKIGVSSPPFTLNGKPYASRPVGLQNISEFIRREGALQNPSAQGFYDDDQYSTINLELNNIIGEETSTTLRYNNNVYTQRFIALHKNLWGVTGVSVSLFFTTNDYRKVFHIVVPVNYTVTSENENIFLKYWLYTNVNINENPPSNLTTNELLNFRGSTTTANCITAQYCLKASNFDIEYNLCTFQNSLNLNRTLLPSWIQNDLFMLYNDSTHKKTIDQIMNLMLHGNMFIYRNTFATSGTTYTDRKLLSQSTYFTPINITDGDTIRNTTEQTIKGTYFNIPIKDIAGSAFKRAPKPGVKTLENIKCYPIDLASQINEDGSISVDETTDKPLSPADATSQTNRQTYNADSALKEKEARDNWIFMIVAFVTFGILLIVGIIVTVFILQGKPVGSTATTAVVAAAAAAGAAASSGGTANP